LLTPTITVFSPFPHESGVSLASSKLIRQGEAIEAQQAFALPGRKIITIAEEDSAIKTQPVVAKFLIRMHQPSIKLDLSYDNKSTFIPMLHLSVCF